ncbi:MULTISPECIES: hypothetical protein [Lactobacillales]|jgi:hypothetical protein|uniref:Uncharacterized protein n=4 Tax=Bacilli TaxID=91061 RepID=A0AAJ2IU16_9LACT|nr:MULTISPECIES: hypothetical protein [Lactobacillales]MDG3106451.1 hypothetical protein [Streptococcus suis]HAP3403281.1 hypothetical protein [Enterococcus faecalis]ARR88257.1 hypothetical protein BSR25_2481 [Lactococcus lactis subsp. lactis bv. diacetylactis]MBP8751084.1 hypothetical protein [Enterococcus sp.]MBZ3643062.1 hypothetical protein [Enterococcus casseliflavus]
MSRKRIFEPVVYTVIATDGLNHSEDVRFKISYGYELENPNPVFKVQMIQGTLLKGRQAPSYSDHDLDRIMTIREKLKEKFDLANKLARDIEYQELDLLDS